MEARKMSVQHCVEASLTHRLPLQLLAFFSVNCLFNHSKIAPICMNIPAAELVCHCHRSSLHIIFIALFNIPHFGESNFVVVRSACQRIRNVNTLFIYDIFFPTPSPLPPAYRHLTNWKIKYILKQKRRWLDLISKHRSQPWNGALHACTHTSTSQ